MATVLRLSILQNPKDKILPNCISLSIAVSAIYTDARHLYVADREYLKVCSYYILTDSMFCLQGYTFVLWYPDVIVYNYVYDVNKKNIFDVMKRIYMLEQKVK